jgi:tartrate dehydrogenase/decarboxylase/D-malate dehydrogenase
MMLEHLGHADAAAEVLRAIETVLAEGARTPDLGGKATTTDLGKAITSVIEAG